MNSHDSTASLRAVMRSLHYGLYVLTAGQGDDAHAATITWVMQASQKPRRVAIGVRKDSHIYPVLQAAGTFALNVVGQHGEALAASFFRFTPAVEHHFLHHPFEDGPETGSPLLLEALAWLECRTVEEANSAGDHGLFVADVLAGEMRQPDGRVLSLADTGWSYGG